MCCAMAGGIQLSKCGGRGHQEIRPRTEVYIYRHCLSRSFHGILTGERDIHHCNTTSFPSGGGAVAKFPERPTPRQRVDGIGDRAIQNRPPSFAQFWCNIHDARARLGDEGLGERGRVRAWRVAG
jgi:hypothetical protein